ncbi:1364_t:CDS:2, partial [Racocetra fulgida]
MSKQLSSSVEITSIFDINNPSFEYDILICKNGLFEINERYYNDLHFCKSSKSIFDFSNFYKLTDIQKESQYEYMLYAHLAKNNTLSYFSKTQFYVNGEWININNGNENFHSNFNGFEYTIQGKWKSSSEFVSVEDVEKFIGTMVDQPNRFGFFVSNVGYSEKAINRVRNSSVKNIILCSENTLIELIKRLEFYFKNRNNNSMDLYDEIIIENLAIEGSNVIFEEKPVKEVPDGYA